LYYFFINIFFLLIYLPIRLDKFFFFSDFDRTWQSLKNRFNKTIVLNLKSYITDPKLIKKFMAGKESERECCYIFIYQACCLFQVTCNCLLCNILKVISEGGDLNRSTRNRKVINLVCLIYLVSCVPFYVTIRQSFISIIQGEKKPLHITEHSPKNETDEGSLGKIFQIR
jgi:hypothetical protein